MTQIPIPPHVRIGMILTEAARQEIYRRSCNRIEKIRNLSATKDKYTHMLQQSIDRRHQLKTVKVTSKSNGCPNNENQSHNTVTAADTKISVNHHHRDSMLEERAYRQAVTDTTAAIRYHTLLMTNEADDVAQCYASLIQECEGTLVQIAFEGERINAINTESELQNFADHVLTLHSSLLPWRNGILLEPSITCTAGNPLYDRGWLANGRGECMRFLSFAATTEVVHVRQTLFQNKRKVLEEANGRLREYRQQQLMRNMPTIIAHTAPLSPLTCYGIAAGYIVAANTGVEPIQTFVPNDSMLQPHDLGSPPEIQKPSAGAYADNLSDAAINNNIVTPLQSFNMTGYPTNDDAFGSDGSVEEHVGGVAKKDHFNDPNIGDERRVSTGEVRGAKMLMPSPPTHINGDEALGYQSTSGRSAINTPESYTEGSVRNCLVASASGSRSCQETSVDDRPTLTINSYTEESNNYVC